MRFFRALIIIAIVSFSGHGSILIATTEDGRKVLLKEDGSWKFATSNDITAVKTMQSNNAASSQANQQSGPAEDGARVQMKPQSPDEPERAGFLDVVRGEGTFDIRKAFWGMEKTEVKKSENLQLMRETPTTLEYKFKLIGIESKIVYKFASDKTGKSRLVGAQYLIEQDDVNPARFFEDYK